MISRRYCTHCGDDTKHEKPRHTSAAAVVGLAGVVLVLINPALGALVLLAAVIAGAVLALILPRGWRCSTCGTRAPLFGRVDNKTNPRS